MTKRMTLTAALCAFAATPALAHAGTEYRVEATGSGTYKLDIDLSGDSGLETRAAEASFAWSAQLEGVRFDDTGQLQGTYATPTEPTKLTGTVKRTYDQSSPGHSSHTTCEGSDVRDEGLSVTSLEQVGGSGYGLSFKPFESLVFVDHKCTGSAAEAVDLFATEGDPHSLWEPAGGLSVFEQRFELPREAVGMGKIVQLVKPQQGQVLAGNCPGYSQAPGERCTATLEWSGTITFTKVAGTTPAPASDGDDLVTPLVPPKPGAGSGPVAPPVPPKPFDDPLIAPLVPAKLKVGPGARTVSFQASCPAGCAGTAVVTPAGGGPRAVAAAARRAVLRFRIAAGGPKTVRLTLPASVRRTLRGAKRAKLVVTLRPPAGAARKTTLTVALPRR
jgi:hypothetical protein